MSRVSLNRKRVKLKRLLGIRARLALLALILVAPLMLERARSLENARSKEIALAAAELSDLAQRSADAEREVISSVQTMLKSTAYIRASAGGADRSCNMLRASLPVNLPWIRSLMIVGRDGRVQCSTLNRLVGLDLSDRPELAKARQTGDFVLGDFHLSKSNNLPMVIAVYPVSAISDDADSLIVAGVNLDWMSKVMGNLGGRPGISAALVDSAGIVLAAPPDQAGMIGRPLDSGPLLSAIAERTAGLDPPQGLFSVVTGDDTKRAVSFTRIPGTQSHLIVSIDEATVSAAINPEIRTAHLQLGLVCLFALFGALVAAEKLIIRPIGVMAAIAERFGQGEWSARLARKALPAEFVPLARAFNAMAAQLGQRQRELLASNDRLTVIASVDMLTGLANRRGLQSRLEFEWLRAGQYDCELSLLMIDVDHFKLYNDSYGHPEGDACLARIGEALNGIAAETMGLAGRYGGEEFCLLLPNTDAIRAIEIGETARASVEALAIPHATSNFQIVTVSIGVAATKPSDSQRPGDLIEAADAALYAAKHRGRNTVVRHGFARASDAGIKLAG
jgi:diguanylate cyclase (GGDEF)-like protein